MTNTMGRYSQANRRGGQLSGYTIPPPTNADWMRSISAHLAQVVSLTPGPGGVIDGMRLTVTTAADLATVVDEVDTALEDSAGGSVALTVGVNYSFRVRWLAGASVQSGFSTTKDLVAT